MTKISVEMENGEVLIYWEGALWKKAGKWLRQNDIHKLTKVFSLKEADLLWVEIENRTAKIFSARWLGQKRLFSLELQERLRSFGFSEKVIEMTLITYQKRGILDDQDLFQAKIDKELRKGKGYKLAFLQCKRWVQENALSPPSQLLQENEREAIVKLLEKKRVQNLGSLSWKEKQTLYAFLLRRGFAQDNIYAVLQEGEGQ